MTATDTADAALWLTGILFWFWIVGIVWESHFRRKYRDVPRHEEKR